jgi:methylenetetrahydrofolate dehydrogenase (NADP+) / methenyltetrahydrofolate cyclohydrolase
MIIDGKKLAETVEARIARSLLGVARMPVLAIVVVGDSPVTERFVRIKKRVAERLGITVSEFRFARDVRGETVVATLRALAEDEHVNGIVVQLPLPDTLDAETVMNMIPLAKDVDVLSRQAMATFARGDAEVLPPVAGAVQEILEFAEVAVVGKETLVLGHGRLVGVPVALLLRHNGAHVTVIDKPIANLAEHVRESHIIVSGVGKPGLITPDMLAPGTVIIDAGTSESGGKLAGDADPRCAEVAGLFTPVPGGVGPLAVTMIFKNLCILAALQHQLGS